MNDLPISDPSGNTPAPDPTAVSQQTTPVKDDSFVTGVGIGNKESAPIYGAADRKEGLSDATGQEFELPKEVTAAGVHMHPTTVAIPVPVTKLGVQPSGANVPVQTTSSVVLPLSDDQIAKGLHEGITNSVRWLAEWCVRRLKYLHVTLKNVHGTFVRVKE